jgi:hypothetical protein
VGIPTVVIKPRAPGQYESGSVAFLKGHKMLSRARKDTGRE